MKMTKEEREYWEARYAEACTVFDCTDQRGQDALVAVFWKNHDLLVTVDVKKFLLLSEELKMALFFFGASSPRSFLKHLINFNEGSDDD